MVTRRIRDEREDDVPAEQQPSRPAEPGAEALRALQRSAGNRATAALVARRRGLSTADRALLQARWLVHDSPNYYFWEDEPGKPRPGDHEVPPYLKRIQRKDAPRPPYLIDDGDGEPTLVPPPPGDGRGGVRRPPQHLKPDNPYAKQHVPSSSRRNRDSTQPARGNDVPTFYEGEWYAERARQGGAARAPGDMFNPFGRFGSAAVTSFLPSAALSADQKVALLTRLDTKDKSYLAIVQPDPNAPRPQLSPADERRLYYLGYPRHVQVSGGVTLPLADVTTYGAVYAFGAPQPDAHEIAQPVKAPGDPAALGLIPMPAMVKYEQNFALTPQLIATWQGLDRSEQQKAVMGASAADVMRNAGYAVGDSREWEWLHMIAHSMGGIGGTAPQVPANLVVGTRECNSEMIIAEEMLKTIVVKTGAKGSAKLEVGVHMLDPVRHIASSISYTFLLYNAQGSASMVENFAFSPLDKTQPQQFKNRAMRYIATLMHLEGTGAPAWPTQGGHEVMTGPSAYDSPSPEALERDQRADQLITLVTAGRLDDLNRELALTWSQDKKVSGYVFDAIGETIPTPDAMLAYLSALRAFAGPRTAVAEQRIVRASLLDHKLTREQLRAVLTRLYGASPLSPKLVELVGDAPLAVT